MQEASGVAEVRRTLTILVLILVACCGLAGAAGAVVNLEWRPAYQVVHAGDPVRLGLYAVSTGANAAMSGMDVIVTHDPDTLAFQNLLADGAGYNWLLDGFMSPSPGGINDSIDDGDMYYTAWAQLGVPAIATRRGLLVTTFEFVASSPTCASVVAIPLSFTGGAITRVLDGTVPNRDIKGTVGIARVMIVEPTTLTSVAETKKKSDGTSVTVAGPIVTRAFPLGDCFYIEDQNRAAGIRVNCPGLPMPSEGSTPKISGTVRTVNGERVVDAVGVYSGTGCMSEPVPGSLGIICRSVYQGLSPQGMLVRMQGRASSVTTGSFLLSDGSDYAWQPMPIKVELHGVQAPAEGDFVVMTGTLGHDADGPVLRVN